MGIPALSVSFFSFHVLRLLHVVCTTNIVISFDKVSFESIMLGLTAPRRSSTAFLSSSRMMHPTVRMNSVSSSDSFSLVNDMYPILYLILCHLVSTTDIETNWILLWHEFRWENNDGISSCVIFQLQKSS